MYIRIFYIYLVICTFRYYVPELAHSQVHDKFIIESWKVENGLPQHTVNDIAQTSDGFIWIGTEGGLARFDGFSFKVYDRSSSPVLSTNRITALASDSKNRLYIGNRDGGIGYFENGRFYVMDLGSKSNDMSVSSIVVNAKNEVYFTSKSFGLIRYKNGSTYNYDLSDNEKRALRNVVSNEYGEFLIFDKKIELIQADKRVLFYSETSNDVILNLFFHKENDEFIILTKDHLLKKKSDRITTLDSFDRYDLTFINNPLDPVLGHYLLYMIKGRVHLYDLKSSIIIRNHPLFNQYSDLWINLVTVDKDDNYWLGTESNGFMRLRLNPFQIYPEFDESIKIDEKPLPWYKNNSLAAYQTPNGTQFLSYLNSTTRKVESNGSSSLLPQFNIRTNTFYSFLEDRSKNFYIGSLGNGLYKLNGFTLELLPFKDDVNRWIFAIYQDKLGRIMVGTRGSGLFELNNDSLSYAKNIPESLKTANISYIAEFGDTLWVSSDESIFSRIGNLWTDWSTKVTIERDFFRGIESFDSNYIIIGSYGNGFLFLNPKTMESRRLSVSNGLRDNVASYIHVDNDGNVWSTGNLGLTFINNKEIKQFLYANKSTIVSTTYNKIHGAPTDEYQGGYLNSGLVLSDGQLLLPGLNGFVKADIKALISSKPPEKVFIDWIKYGSDQYQYVDSLFVEYSNSSLEIKYTAPFFSSNIKPIYLHKLEGIDQDWVEGNELQTISYSNLPPGKYTLTIKVGLKDGKWSSNDTTLHISVIPPFYMTDWFLIISLLCGILLVYIIIRVSNQKWIAIQQRRFSLILDAQEQERKRIAADLHDGVGQLLSAIKLRLDYAKKNDTGDRKELNEIITESRSLIDNIADEIRNISFNLIPSSLKKFGLIKAMDETIQKTSFGHDLVIKFIPITQKERYDENVELTLYRIFQELLFNATKHANAKEIDIQLIEHQNEIILMFEDDGTGFDYQKALVESSGSGISNISSRVHILGGTLNFDTDKNNGTTVTVTIPNRS